MEVREQNRIIKIFSDGEVLKIGLTKATERIKDEFGVDFRCNRTECDWITQELNEDYHKTNVKVLNLKPLNQ